jgi:undecaprenyl pyrophosphate phosphatase UppP
MLMKIADAFLFFSFFVGIPTMAAAVAYAAWRGWPRNFSRDKYFIAFCGIGFASTILFVSAQRMMPVGVWHQLLQEVCGGVGLLLFGVSMGCGVGIFTFRRRPPSPNPHE